MRTSKTSILIAGLLSVLALTLVACNGNQKPPKPNKSVVNMDLLAPDKEKIIGTWVSKMSCDRDNSSMKLKKTFFQNGSYNLSGVVSTRHNIDNEEVEFTVSVEGSGEWMISDLKMTDKIVDARFTPKSLRKGAAQLDLSKTDDPAVSEVLADSDFKQSMETANQSFIKGQSTEYQIINLDKSEMKLENISDKTSDACVKVEKYKKQATDRK